jgi:hypothetical protein
MRTREKYDVPKRMKGFNEIRKSIEEYSRN